MDKADQILKAIEDLEQRLTERLDRLERKVDYFAGEFLSPHEHKLKQFASLSAKTEPRNR